jgi:hypothetical protein
MRCPRNICHSKVRLRFGGWQTWRDYFYLAQDCRTSYLPIVPPVTRMMKIGPPTYSGKETKRPDP